MYSLKKWLNTGTLAYKVSAIKNANVSPHSIASTDNFNVTPLYLNIIGINFITKSKSKFTNFTYSPGSVVSILNHNFDNSANVPSSLMALIVAATSSEIVFPSSSFLKGYALTS